MQRYVTKNHISKQYFNVSQRLHQTNMNASKFKVFYITHLEKYNFH